MVKRVTIELSNCYEIDSLLHTFDFSNNNMPVIVYAPNGVMRTSLAKSLRQYVNDRPAKDIFFPERSSSMSIQDESGADLTRESVLVIEPIDEKYQSARMSTLLASEDLKAQYDDIFASIADKRDKLLKALRQPSGLSKDIDLAISSAFNVQRENLLVALARLEREVGDRAHSQFASLKYQQFPVD